MAIINQATKELQLKIVYYGPAMCGKTTNLVQVHDHVQTAQGNKGKLVSLATSSDRTLFFDFLPIEAMAIKGFRTKFQLYTVPGQVIYNTTRQLVLRGVDGIVFVADSQYNKMAENVESFANLVENLKTLKLDLADIPYVLQYNKRDLQNVAPTSMRACVQRAASRRGTSESASCWSSAGRRPSPPATTRPSTLRTFVSTAPTRPSNAIATTARAVYGPIPGRLSRPATSRGRRPAWSSTTRRAVRWRFSARRL